MDKRYLDEAQTQGTVHAEYRPPRRRMSDHRLESLAESAVLKVAQYAVTAIAIPALAWFTNAVLDRLTKIETVINMATTQSATFELRVAALERAGIEREAAIKMLTEQYLRHSYQLQRLEEVQQKASAK
jgi:hypothetical protein